MACAPSLELSPEVLRFVADKARSFERIQAKRAKAAP
jgi:hypothetical protein